MDTAKPPSGRRILEAVRDELVNNLYELPTATLPPTIFHVYLHPSDFDVVEGIVPRIAADVGGVLTRHVERLNRESSRRGLLGRLRQQPARAPIEVPSGGWEIHIQADHDDELARGALGILSKLTIPAPPEYIGPPTVRTIKTIVAEGLRTSAVVSGSDAASDPVAASTTRSSAAVPHATLRYQDDMGPHVVPVHKDVIKIGRGGPGTWVDVQIITGPKVSREHCRIRSGPGGRFFICDVSTWGTSVNGQPLPAAIRSDAGAVVEPGSEIELLPGARIELADAVTIEFRVGERP
jgi:FHA domain